MRTVDPTSVPIVLVKAPVVAKMYGLAEKTVRQKALDGTHFPKPWRDGPWRWRLDHLHKDLGRRRLTNGNGHRLRPKLRMAKAPLPSRRRKAR